MTACRELSTGQRGILAAGNAQSIRDGRFNRGLVDVTERYRTLPGNGGRTLLRYSPPRGVTVTSNRPVSMLLGCSISQPVTSKPSCSTSTVLVPSGRWERPHGRSGHTSGAGRHHSPSVNPRPAHLGQRAMAERRFVTLMLYPSKIRSENAQGLGPLPKGHHA